eukprot:12620902-Prorocentrum_lima.AAC.1
MRQDATSHASAALSTKRHSGAATEPPACGGGGSRCMPVGMLGPASSREPAPDLRGRLGCNAQ